MIRPIETRYKGRRFRSRLEARWAVFFDHLDIPWEYEPEGFHTEDGPYLPDFRLWGRVWAEVKPDEGLTFAKHASLELIAAMPWARKCEELAYGFGMDVLVCIGEPTSLTLPLCVCWGEQREDVQWLWGGWQAYDEGRIWWEMPDDQRHDSAACIPRVQAAVRAALSARFEHGEHGEFADKIQQTIARSFIGRVPHHLRRR